MKRSTKAINRAACALLALAGAASVLVPAGAHAQQIGISTAPQGTAGYSMAAAIAKVITEKAGLAARVQPYSGSSAALPPLNNGEVDFSVCNEIEAVEAINGDGAYQGKKQQNLRMAAILYPFTVGLYVKKDSPLKTIADLKGQRMPWGYTAQVTIKQILLSILASEGMGEKDIRPVMVPNVMRGADEFSSGKADVFFFANGAGKVLETDAAVGGLRALQMRNTPQTQEAVKKVLPQAYIIEIKPRKGMAGINEPTQVLGYDYTFVVGKHVKDEVVHKVLKALAENKASLVESFGGFAGFQPEHLGKKMTVEYHPGAIKYLTESKQWPPK